MAIPRGEDRPALAAGKVAEENRIEQISMEERPLCLEVHSAVSVNDALALQYCIHPYRTLLSCSSLLPNPFVDCFVTLRMKTSLDVKRGIRAWTLVATKMIS
jgi:hypothetical protein